MLVIATLSIGDFAQILGVVLAATAGVWGVVFWLVRRNDLVPRKFRRRIVHVERALVRVEHQIAGLTELASRIDVLARVHTGLITRLLTTTGETSKLPKGRGELDRLGKNVEAARHELMLFSLDDTKRLTAIRALSQSHGDYATLELAKKLAEASGGDARIMQLVTELEARLIPQ